MAIEQETTIASHESMMDAKTEIAERPADAREAAQGHIVEIVLAHDHVAGYRLPDYFRAFVVPLHEYGTPDQSKRRALTPTMPLNTIDLDTFLARVAGLSRWAEQEPQRVVFDVEAPDDCLLCGKVRAKVHTDDYAFAYDFNAAPWFAQATDSAITDLANCGWGDDFPADGVAEYMSTYDERIERLFQYLGIRNQGQGDAIGFECRVDIGDAAEWLAENRPQLLAQIKR